MGVRVRVRSVVRVRVRLGVRVRVRLSVRVRVRLGVRVRRPIETNFSLETLLAEGQLNLCFALTIFSREYFGQRPIETNFFLRFIKY